MKLVPGASRGMSALPPKADMCSATTDVRFVPIADIQIRVFYSYKYPLLAQSGACFGLDQQSPAVMFQTHLFTQEERALWPIHMTRLQ